MSGGTAPTIRFLDCLDRMRAGDDAASWELIGRVQRPLEQLARSQL